MTRTCMDCEQPVTWIRYTQFAGNHPFCEEHAKLQQDFGANDSYLYWKELKMTNENIDRIESIAMELVLNGEDPDGDVDDMYIPAEFTRKFAELLIRECADQIVAKGTDQVDFAPSQTGVRPEYWDMAQHIKRHFGVE